MCKSYKKTHHFLGDEFVLDVFRSNIGSAIFLLFDNGWKFYQSYTVDHEEETMKKMSVHERMEKRRR